MNTVPPTTPKPPAMPSGMDHDALPPGTRFGEFEILRVLGVGGFGIVYLANDHSLEREVALKEYMPASLAARGQGPQITVRSSSFAETYAIGLRSFVNEARLLARFDHPSLVKVYRFWEDNATAYMVMPFLQGVTLRDTRRAMPHPPDEAWIRSVITPILSALELLHKEGVYHRDIAPDNILLPPDGPPVLLDFGAARRVISDRTQSLTAILKPSYAPIEQYAEMVQMRQGPWTDLYALGAVIHYLLFGVPPAPATARAVQDDADTIENRIVPGVSPLFLEAVAWMLSIRPNQRPQSGEQLRAVLDGHATIPPRGRPGITIPGALAPAAPVAATQPPLEPTRHVDHAAAPTQVVTSHVPTHLPTAPQRAPAPAPQVTTFSPTSQMPTPRVGAAPPTLPPSRPTAGVTAPAAAAAAARTAAPPLPPTSPPTRPSPLSPQASRPAPLAASRPVAAASSQPSSKTGLVVGSALLFAAVVAFAGWHFMARRGAPAVDAAIAGASAASGPTVAAAPAVLPSPPVPAPVPAPVPSAVAVSPPPTSSAPSATAVAPPSSTGMATASTGFAAASAVRQPGSGLPVPPVVADGNRTGATSPSGTGPAGDRSLPSDRSTLNAAASSASGARVRVAGRPVPTNDPTVGGTARPGDGTASYGTPGNAGPGAGGTGANDRSRPYGTAGARDPVPSQRPPIVAQSDPESAPSSAREACGKRVFIALAICMDEKCEEPRFRTTQECIGILNRKTLRENR